jgi:predicted transcriptional regulator
MPNQPKTPARSVRVGDDLWSAAKRTAAERGEDVSDVIRQALARYVKRHASGDEPAQGG